MHWSFGIQFVFLFFFALK